MHECNTLLFLSWSQLWECWAGCWLIGLLRPFLLSFSVCLCVSSPLILLLLMCVCVCCLLPVFCLCGWHNDNRRSGATEVVSGLRPLTMYKASVAPLLLLSLCQPASQQQANSNYYCQHQLLLLPSTTATNYCQHHQLLLPILTDWRLPCWQPAIPTNIITSTSSTQLYHNSPPSSSSSSSLHQILDLKKLIYKER